MIKGWLIYRQEDATENKAYINWFIHEAQKQNIQLTLILREHLLLRIVDHKHEVILNGSKVSPPDFAVVRTVEPFLNRFLENVGIRVFNSSAISYLCNDKFNTYNEMSKLNIPIVETYFYNRVNMNHTPPLSYPFIVKDPTGRSGKQVFLIKSAEDWQIIHSTIKGDLVIQSCNVQLGKDLRIFVIGKEIIGSVLRENENDFRANFKLGGEAKLYHLNNDEKNLVNKIVQSHHFDLVGIDFLIGHNGQLLFNEIEDVVGSRILSATTDINLLQKYVQHILKEMKK